MLALIPVRDGVLPAGAGETAAECGGRVLLVGPAAGIDDAAVASLGREVRILDLGAFGPARWAAELAPLVADEAVVVLPASPDGRDLAPRLAHQLGRPLFAGAVEVTVEHVTVSRRGGQVLHDHRIDQPVVATLQPGIRGVEPFDPEHSSTPIPVLPAPDEAALVGATDCEILALLPPDVTTMDLAEAPRILGGGAGLDTAERFEQLAGVALALGASMGATRVITDRGWVGHERQIGTTGVIVDPELYMSFGISGAVQHTSGLGHPHHVISVNTDPHCPMMQLSDLAVVSDANAVLEALDRLVTRNVADV